MGAEDLRSAVRTVDQSIRFLLLFFLGLLLSLHAILLQRQQLCLTLEGGDPSSLPSPYPFQHASGALSLGGLVFFYQLARQTYQTAREEGGGQAEFLARWNLLATALVLIAAAVRLWALELSQSQQAEALIQEEDVELPI